MTDDQIKAERQKVYGDPLMNHYGIAMAMAPLLQPAWRMVRDMVPLPPHLLANLLGGPLKTNRTRLRFHQDNYDDARIYQGFACEWQRAFDEKSLPMQKVWEGHSLDDSVEEESRTITVARPRAVAVTYANPNVKITYSDGREEWWTISRADGGCHMAWYNKPEAES